MTTRRSFLAALVAGAAALGLTRFGRGSPAGEMSSRTAGETSAAPPRGERSRTAVRGVPGVTYFKVGDGHDLASRYRLCLDGRDVTNEASECDAVAGWARMHRVTKRHPDGSPAWFASGKGNGLTQYVAFGRVELRLVQA